MGKSPSGRRGVSLGVAFALITVIAAIYIIERKDPDEFRFGLLYYKAKPARHCSTSQDYPRDHPAIWRYSTGRPSL